MAVPAVLAGGEAWAVLADVGVWAVYGVDVGVWAAKATMAAPEDRKAPTKGTECKVGFFLAW